MELRRFALGFATCLTLFVGCAATFPYRYYGLSAESYKGRLLGPKPEDDANLSACTPTASDASPCVVLFTKDALALKQDYKDTQNKLKKCEAGK